MLEAQCNNNMGPTTGDELSNSECDILHFDRLQVACAVSVMNGRVGRHMYGLKNRVCVRIHRQPHLGIVCETSEAKMENLFGNSLTGTTCM